MIHLTEADVVQLMPAVPPPDGAIHVEIVAAQRLVLLKYAHTPAITEWTAAMDGVLADPGYGAGFGFLLDLRGNKPGPSRMLIAAMLHYLDEHRVSFQGGRWALLVDSSGGLRMAHAGQNLATGLPLLFAVFHDHTPDKALRWLRRFPTAATAAPSLRLA